MRKFAEEQRQKEIDEQRQREKQKFLELQGEVGLIPESSGLPTPAKEATQKTESIQNHTPVADSPAKTIKSSNKNDKNLNDRSS